mmetsp:Transcript_5458/g.12050  ORF Transcript_5458/g.12050 Transcript_5458/m.12050 type:complete len:223 (-) Transcript_5458:796-1464(-)
MTALRRPHRTPQRPKRTNMTGRRLTVVRSLKRMHAMRRLTAVVKRRWKGRRPETLHQNGRTRMRTNPRLLQTPLLRQRTMPPRSPEATDRPKPASKLPMRIHSAPPQLRTTTMQQMTPLGRPPVTTGRVLPWLSRQTAIALGVGATILMMGLARPGETRTPLGRRVQTGPTPLRPHHRPPATQHRPWISVPPLRRGRTRAKTRGEMTQIGATTMTCRRPTSR